MSLKINLIENLMNEHRLSDEQLSRIMKIDKIKIQNAISQINRSKKKYKSIIIITLGKRGSLSRELSNKDTDTDLILDSRDNRLNKGIRQIDVARKEGLLGMNTRKSVVERQKLVNQILEQNLNAMIETQKLLTKEAE